MSVFGISRLVNGISDLISGQAVSLLLPESDELVSSILAYAPTFLPAAVAFLVFVVLSRPFRSRRSAARQRCLRFLYRYAGENYDEFRQRGETLEPIRLHEGAMWEMERLIEQARTIRTLLSADLESSPKFLDEVEFLPVFFNQSVQGDVAPDNRLRATGIGPRASEYFASLEGIPDQVPTELLDRCFRWRDELVQWIEVMDKCSSYLSRPH